MERGPNSEGGEEEILFGDVGRRRIVVTDSWGPRSFLFPFFFGLVAAGCGCGWCGWPGPGWVSAQPHHRARPEC